MHAKHRLADPEQRNKLAVLHGSKRKKFFVDGYRFVIASQSDSTVYLKCANFRNQCKARASKRKSSPNIYLTKDEHKGCIRDPGSEEQSDAIESINAIKLLKWDWND